MTEGKIVADKYTDLKGKAVEKTLAKTWLVPVVDPAGKGTWLILNMEDFAREINNLDERIADIFTTENPDGKHVVYDKDKKKFGLMSVEGTAGSGSGVLTTSETILSKTDTRSISGESFHEAVRAVLFSTAVPFAGSQPPTDVADWSADTDGYWWSNPDVTYVRHNGKVWMAKNADNTPLMYPNFPGWINRGVEPGVAGNEAAWEEATGLSAAQVAANRWELVKNNTIRIDEIVAEDLPSTYITVFSARDGYQSVPLSKVGGASSPPAGEVLNAVGIIAPRDVISASTDRKFVTGAAYRDSLRAALVDLMWQYPPVEITQPTINGQNLLFWRNDLTYNSGSYVVHNLNVYLGTGPGFIPIPAGMEPGLADSWRWSLEQPVSADFQGAAEVFSLDTPPEEWAEGTPYFPLQYVKRNNSYYQALTRIFGTSDPALEENRGQWRVVALAQSPTQSLLANLPNLMYEHRETVRTGSNLLLADSKGIYSVPASVFASGGSQTGGGETTPPVPPSPPAVAITELIPDRIINANTTVDGVAGELCSNLI